MEANISQNVDKGVMNCIMGSSVATLALVALIPCDALPKSLIDSNESLK
jgi:hypothetical protein